MGGSGAAESVGSLDVALSHALNLIDGQPQAAAEQAAEILRAAPGHPIAELVLGMARRRLGDHAAALQVLEPLARTQPSAGAAHYELGLARSAAGDGDGAVSALQRAVELAPTLPGAWLALADHLAAVGDTTGSSTAYARHIKAATRDPRLLRPAAALCENNIPVAEALLRAHLRENPTDVAALRMLAEVAGRIGRDADAEHLLARCLELAPAFAEARVQYAMMLNRQNRASQALVQVEQLLAGDARNPNYRNLKANVLVNLGEFSAAAAIFEELLRQYPRHARVWLSYGHTLRTGGRVDESIRAYRRSLELTPQLGEAWWALANLKTFRFDATDIDAMRAVLARSDLVAEDQWHLHFALGKAYEDRQEYAESFARYASANRLRRAQLEYSAADNHRYIERNKALFTREFLARRAGAGSEQPDPIFIVGLPRSGSTLIDQILSSHSMVEGTMELHDLISIARELDTSTPGTSYPEVLGTLEFPRLRAVGEQYLERTRVQRKRGAPFFIDKMPNNFRHVGMILLALPRAKIIDARRHPVACCFSAFKQHFARGQAFSYSLEDVGAYYRDYVDLMTHFDAVAPGRIHRVHYESMVENTEAEVRALLEYCGLPFEAQCLRFYENERAVRTASSEQVRRPIFRDGLEQWRHYAPWLEPLQEVLGPVLQAYPDVPNNSIN